MNAELPGAGWPWHSLTELLQPQPTVAEWRLLAPVIRQGVAKGGKMVRVVQEHRGEYPSLWAAVESIAPKIGCVPQTLLEWVKRQEVDIGFRDGVTSTEAQRVKELERENKELRRANEIRKVASAFFAKAELDRRLKS